MQLGESKTLPLNGCHTERKKPLCHHTNLTEAPTTSVIVGPADPNASSLATFIFTGSDNQTSLAELQFQCRLDSSDPNAWADCESPVTYTGLGLGAHLFEVRAVDVAGNTTKHLPAIPGVFCRLLPLNRKQVC